MRAHIVQRPARLPYLALTMHSCVVVDCHFHLRVGPLARFGKLCEPSTIATMLAQAMFWDRPSRSLCVATVPIAVGSAINTSSGLAYCHWCEQVMCWLYAASIRGFDYACVGHATCAYRASIGTLMRTQLFFSARTSFPSRCATHGQRTIICLVAPMLAGCLRGDGNLNVKHDKAVTFTR